ncbi:MAG: hypothetical protein Q8P62_04930 [Candidatus Peregrinibacteria bacterium]|nr:hypothetical protein [Candidatus Peregrinibacteria bacterium]
MKFSYSQFPGLDGESVYRPSIRIFLKYQNRFIFTEGFVDSGADYTILPLEFAGELGLKLDVNAKTKFIGAGKNPFVVYPSKVKIKHVIRQSGFRNLEWESKVYFAESQPGILLGNCGFLDHFRVILDGLKKEIEII